MPHGQAPGPHAAPARVRAQAGGGGAHRCRAGRRTRRGFEQEVSGLEDEGQVGASRQGAGDRGQALVLTSP